MQTAGRHTDIAHEPVVAAVEHRVVDMLAARIENPGQFLPVRAGHPVEHQVIVGRAAVLGEIVDMKQQPPSLFGQDAQGRGQDHVLAQAVVVDMDQIGLAAQGPAGGGKNLGGQILRADGGPAGLVPQGRDHRAGQGKRPGRRLAAQDHRPGGGWQGRGGVLDDPGHPSRLQVIVDNGDTHGCWLSVAGMAAWIAGIHDVRPNFSR